MSDLRLGVNIDHVATLRQTRYAAMPESKNAEPDPKELKEEPEVEIEPIVELIHEGIDDPDNTRRS